MPRGKAPQEGSEDNKGAPSGHGDQNKVRDNGTFHTGCPLIPQAHSSLSFATVPLFVPGCF